MTEKQIERFRRVEAIFDGALERPAGAERDAFLRSQGDAELEDEVRQLLEDHDRVRAAVPEAPEAMPQFGPWRAIRLLGRGGMGTVYLAERADGTFQMSAAVKVVPLALASIDIEERFRRERQFLASLDHPKIARLIDGGVTSAGLPYLVMEFVDGLAIDRYCDAHSLDARGRIAMVRQMLEALIYVHGRQVIHRDLKPSNILVDAAGSVKLLDFGTARLVDASGDNAITKTGVFAFTPESASPEQMQGKSPTFASDIYSTGALLYRMLTGRVYAADDPVADRAFDARLEAILRKALRTNPEERYASAAEMDADLARYLKGAPVQARRSRKLGTAATIAALIALFAVGAGIYFTRRAARAPASIVVLPFTNLSADPNSRYLSNGTTEGVTEALSRVKTLRVIAPSQVGRFTQKPVDTGELARMLHVANVLQGSMTPAGDRIRIDVQLKRAVDGVVLWSESFDRTTAELLSVESEMAAGVERTLNVAPDAPRAKHVPKPQAHDYFMKARYEAEQMTPLMLAQAESDFQRAIDSDPEYGMAYVGLGIAQYDRSVARGSTGQTEEERRSAERLVRKALELDPDLPSAHAWLAVMAMQFEWDWKGAERELRLALAGPPNSSAEQGYAFLLLFHGRFAEADEHIRRMQDLDPFSTATLNNLMLMRNLEGRFAEARAISQQLLTVYPKMLAARIMHSGTYIEEGHPELAFEEIKKMEVDFPDGVMFEAIADAQAGRREDALRIIRPYEEKYPNTGAALQWFALVYAGLGDGPNTVKWLERSADRHEWQALNLAVHPVYAPMRNLPEFRALERRMGLLP